MTCPRCGGTSVTCRLCNGFPSAVKRPEPTWRNTLNAMPGSSVEQVRSKALDVGYLYVCHNGRIFVASTGERATRTVELTEDDLS